MFKKLFVLILISLVMVACQSDAKDDSSKKALENPVAPTPTSDPALMTQAASNGLIFFADADTLYMQDGAEVETIAENILPRYVHLAPSKTKLLYTTSIPDSDAYTVSVLDLATLTSTQLFESLDHIPILHSWSPDEKWLILTESYSAPKYVIKIDGKEIFEFSQRPEYEDFPDQTNEGTTYLKPKEPYSFETMAWLADNTLLIYEEHYTVDIIRDATRIYHFDPYHDDKNLLNISENILPIYNFIDSWQYSKQLDELLTPLQLEIFPNYDPTKQMVIASDYEWVVEIMPPEVDLLTYNFPPCGDWSVLRKPARQSFLPETIYQAEDTLLLSDLILLPDESMLVTKWQVADCQISNMPIATILHIQPDGEVIELVETPAIANTQVKSGRRNLEIVHNHIVDVSPDKTSIVFVRNDEEANTSALVVMDIATQQEQVIYEAEGSGSLTNVFWGITE